jgi:hypothetical protein
LEQIAGATTVKCFQQAGCKYNEEECEEDTGLNEVIHILPLDVQDVASVGEMESGDADFIIHEEVPPILMKFLKTFFREWKKSLQ